MDKKKYEKLPFFTFNTPKELEDFLLSKGYDFYLNDIIKLMKSENPQDSDEEILKLLLEWWNVTKNVDDELYLMNHPSAYFLLYYIKREITKSALLEIE